LTRFIEAAKISLEFADNSDATWLKQQIEAAEISIQINSIAA